MNIRCAFCQTPYTLSRLQMLDALQEMDAQNLSHYDAHCPRCRRATPVQRQRMEASFPNWRDALKQFEAEMKAHPQVEAPLPKPVEAPVAEAESRPVQTDAKDKPAPDEPTSQKPAAKKPATTRKAATKKSK